jgi:hypothetical protein
MMQNPIDYQSLLGIDINSNFLSVLVYTWAGAGLPGGGFEDPWSLQRNQQQALAADVAPNPL